LLSSSDLEAVLNKAGISNQDRALCCLAFDPLKTRSIGELRDIGVRSGWRGAKDANLSVYLGRAKGFAIQLPDGWKLTPEGQSHVAGLAGAPKSAVPTALTKSLRDHAAKIMDADTRAFVEEAIECVEHGQKRAAIVLSWVGAMSVLQDHVLKSKLTDFNKAGAKKYPKWTPIGTRDDLADLREHDFLQLAYDSSIIGKSVKDELEACLKRRNGCGHPNSLKVGDPAVAAHVDTLILNVFDKY
jgi:hypothetical protein